MSVGAQLAEMAACFLTERFGPSGADRGIAEYQIGSELVFDLVL
jgi:hypothetical protein